MTGITFEGVSKTYPSQSPGSQGSVTPVLRDISFNVDEGEFVCIFGPNGCGKTTFLNLVSGLDPSREGKIEFRDASRSVGFGYIFQNYRESLLPWRTALQNISFPLELRGLPRGQAERRAAEFVDELGVSIPLRQYPYELSGGEQQLLALARALVFGPEVLLLDEPFAALDFTTRFRMRDEVLRIWRQRHLTVLCVSHEIDEAIYMATKLVVFSARPATVLRVLPVTLPHPRNPAMMTDGAFLDLRATALNLFLQEIR